jgi:hypothetical protein
VRASNGQVSASLHKSQGTEKMVGGMEEYLNPHGESCGERGTQVSRFYRAESPSRLLIGALESLGSQMPQLCQRLPMSIGPAPEPT